MNHGVHLCINQRAESAEFASWMATGSQVFKSLVKEEYCLRDEWVEKGSTSEVWVAEKQSCYKRMWHPWSALSSCSERAAVLVLRTFLGELHTRPFCTPCLLPQPHLPSVSIFAHQRKREHPAVSCVSVKECDLDIPSSLMMVSKFWE